MALATAPSGGHPFWHVAAVAAGAVGVFAYIKLQEYRHARNLEPRPSGSLRARLPHHAPWPQPRDLYLTAALCSIGAAAIHATVCPEHFREALIFGVFFAIAASLQAAWTVLLCYRPTQRLLLTGALANTAVILLWTLSRTTGLPVGPEHWHPEAITTPDILATALETILVITTAILLNARTQLHAAAQAHATTVLETV